jgi:16S rRNA (adenine(1408)-N(1))-methyltransferase
VLAGAARLLAPGATGTVLLSVVPRDGLPRIPPRAALAAAYARHGLRLVEARSATAAEVAASGSSWAKRLRAGQARPVTLLRLSAAGAEAGMKSRGDGRDVVQGAAATVGIEGPESRQR